MARKFNEENERIKRQYLHFLREAKRSDMATVTTCAPASRRPMNCKHWNGARSMGANKPRWPMSSG